MPIFSQDYWVGSDAYRFVPVKEFVDAFKNHKVGQANAHALSKPFEQTDLSKKALIRDRYALSCMPPCASSP